MAEIAPILDKVRALGADVVLERGKMTIVNGQGLSAEQRSWIARNRSVIEHHLREKRIAAGSAPLHVPAADDTPPMVWGEFARILYSSPPGSADPCDWSWFITEAGKIIRGELGLPEETVE
jgi:hypothetical protein